MRRSVFALLLVACPVLAQTHAVKIGKHTFTLPKGFTIELVAESPQVDRPVTAAFDDQGRLYVADSSGSNAKPAEQLKNPTHRVVMLESTKKDGKFDKSTVFADKLSFLQGTMWHAGSLYVATPPTIQKLTDTDNDGVADKREVWFDGGVLTGCANDVHGPYPGPDGRIYFTKGAFAKQELTLGNGKKFTTRAAHIYSAKADGSDIRVEMTGGMDNPVDVAFNAAGEMFFTTTFLQHPANGKRDGIIHATYGAVYGKDHDVLADHPRARPELSEPMTQLGPAAPSGLHCYRGAAFGAEYADNLFAANFNLSKVTRHILKEKGSTYETTDSDFVTSDNRDFHPTDVIEDADGSLLIVDTGGWYKLCCPSSVMEKKDVLGAIYRVSKITSVKPGPVPQGEYKPNYSLDSIQPHERRRGAEIVGRSADRNAIPDLLRVLADEKYDAPLDAALTRALIDIGDAKATRKGLEHESDRVKRAALAALAHMPDGKLTPADVVPHLTSIHSDLKATAWWIAGRHPDWGDELADVFRTLLGRDGPPDFDLAQRLARHATSPNVQQVMADHFSKELGVVRFEILWALMQVKELMRALPLTAEKYLRLVGDAERRRVRENRAEWGTDERLSLLSAAPPGAVEPSDEVFANAIEGLRGKERVHDAVEAVTRAKLNGDRMRELAEALPEVSPVHLPALLKLFEKCCGRPSFGRRCGWTR
jgi:putative membrane-bound dehydrogenase-like protein